MIRILYDGWPLVRAPNGPQALHLHSLLQERHPEAQALIVLPGDPPSWLPDGVQTHLQLAADTPRDRLAWEQRSLPHLVKALGADLLHLTTSYPPLFGKASCVVSPAEHPSQDSSAGFLNRIREAFGAGGRSRLRGLFWPADLQAAQPHDSASQIYRLPFPAPSTRDSAEDRSKLAALDLPETYILYHGPGDLSALRRMLDAWSWAAGAVGEYYPMLVLGLDQPGTQRLQSLLAGSELGQTVRILPALDPPSIESLYQGCHAVFHPARLSAWESAGRLALLYGKPLIAAESPLADALAGPAAYLLPEHDTRALGAGLLTVIVEEHIHQGLAQAGQARASTWDRRPFRDELFAAYQAIVDSG